MPRVHQFLFAHEHFREIRNPCNYKLIEEPNSKEYSRAAPVTPKEEAMNSTKQATLETNTKELHPATCGEETRLQGSSRLFI